MSDAKIVRVKHERAPGFASGIATGISIVGPTGDGMFHLLFFRDMQVVIDEPFEATIVDGPNGFTGQALKPAGPGNLEMRREDIASIGLSSSHIAKLGASLLKLAQALNIEAEASEIVQQQHT